MKNLRSVLYHVNDRIATITLNRPRYLNAIDAHMPGRKITYVNVCNLKCYVGDIRQAVNWANNDDSVHAIVVTGAGRSFCSGYDLKQFSEKSEVGPNSINQSMPWDPTVDFKLMKGFTDDFFSLWRSYKPTIAKVRGHCVAGGSDIALCCDMIVMADDAVIGYPPAR